MIREYVFKGLISPYGVNIFKRRKNSVFYILQR